MKTVFVTGGSGFIGSHSILELLNAGYEVVVLDSYVNSVKNSGGHSECLRRVEKITGKSVVVYEGDASDAACLREIFGKVFFFLLYSRVPIHLFFSRVIYFFGGLRDLVCRSLSYI